MTSSKLGSNKKSKLSYLHIFFIMPLFSNYPALLQYYQLCLLECLGQSPVTFTTLAMCVGCPYYVTKCQ